MLDGLLRVVCRGVYRAYPFRRGRWRLLDNLRRWVRGATLVKGKHGLTYAVNLDNLIDLFLYFDGEYEGEVRETLKRLRREGACTIFVDVGMNVGCHAMTIALDPGVERVIGFEPDPRNRAQLFANLWLNDLTQKVDVHAEALSASSGMTEFYLAPLVRRQFGTVQHNTMTSSLQQADERIAVQVRTARFDDLVQLSNQRVLVKIDVEGFELEVLAGMERLLRDNQCVVILEELGEVEGHLKLVEAFMATLEYVPTGERVGDNFVFKRTKMK